MTNAINGNLPPQAEPTNSVPLPRPAISGTAGSNGTAGAIGTPGSEAVTVSTEAQTRTLLLDASRTASGINQPAVTQARTAIQSNLYHVPPEDLATAIVTALKERQS